MHLQERQVLHQSGQGENVKAGTSASTGVLSPSFASASASGLSSSSGGAWRSNGKEDAEGAKLSKSVVCANGDRGVKRANYEWDNFKKMEEGATKRVEESAKSRKGKDTD